MTRMTLNNWQSVQSEVLARLHAREWKPGELIPNEADLAEEFGCARATVNRALQNLAEEGLLDRKRKAGTRVAIHPVRRATMRIPVIRDEITSSGSMYGYNLISALDCAPPSNMAELMRLGPEVQALHVICVHNADKKPYVLEDRWINSDWVGPDERLQFSDISPNQWLVANVPFTAGDIAFSAITASIAESKFLSCAPGQALFAIDRTTRNKERVITSVRLTFAPGYRINTVI